MIHLATGLLILSVACLALSVASVLDAALPSAGPVFIGGSVVATLVSAGFAVYVWRSRL